MKTLMKNHKIAMICLKYIPVIMFLLMWIHMMFAISGWTLVIADSIVGCSILPSILIFALSDVFHFCWTHKCLTGYSLLSDILINIHRYTNATQIILNLKLVMVLIGAVLVLALLIKLKLKSNGI